MLNDQLARLEKVRRGERMEVPYGGMETGAPL